MKKKFNKLNDNTKKIIIISLSILLILVIVLVFFIQNTNNNYKNIKQDKNKYLVYSKLEQDDEKYPKYIPYINIKSKQIDLVNQDIDNITKQFINTNSAITYEYDINGIILSIVIKIIDNKNEYTPEINFRTYNINLDKKELIADESLLDLFKITEEDVSKQIENKFISYYEDLVKQKYYVKEECDYKCFLKYKGIKNYNDNINYYIKDGNLIVYKPFVFYSIFNDEEYFTIDKFEFLIVESKNIDIE